MQLFSTKEKILQRGPSERLQYAIFKNDLFHSLDGTRIEVGYVETAKHCLVKCVKSLQCFSANIGVHLGKNGQVLCELLSSDKYSSAKRFHMNASFHHYRISVSCFFFFFTISLFIIIILFCFCVILFCRLFCWAILVGKKRVITVLFKFDNALT